MTSIARLAGGAALGAIVLLSGPLLSAGAARAALIDGGTMPLLIRQDRFTTADDGAVNPVRTFTGVPGFGTLTISYSPYFQGQTGDAGAVPPTVTGTPVSPLALTSETTLQTVVQIDANAPTGSMEVLGGVPSPATAGFGGPIAILFSAPITGVTLTAGFFDAVATTTITGFAADGTSLGSVLNTATGYERFDLRDDAGAGIAGLLITTTDPAGFGIGAVGVTTIPAPTGAALAGALLTLGLARARRRAG